MPKALGFKFGCMWCEWLGVTTAKLTTVGVSMTRTTQILGSENGSGGDDAMRAHYSRDIFCLDECGANTNACTGTGARLPTSTGCC